mgnify:FL=1|tara:strand:+ start:892 stop:1053 length:162 start_codon:yes stop_codon:yes gene_type:complete
MKNEKNKMLYNNIKLAHSEFIQEMLEKLKDKDALSIKTLEKQVKDNIKTLKKL